MFNLAEAIIKAAQTGKFVSFYWDQQKNTLSIGMEETQPDGRLISNRVVVSDLELVKLKPELRDALLARAIKNMTKAVADL